MKLKEIYDLRSFQKLKDSAKKAGFADSAAGVILARNLTAVDPSIFEKKFPELMLMNSGIAVDNTGGYAKRIESLRVTGQGSFKRAGDTASNKGKISLAGEDSFLKVIERTASSDWSDSEIEEANLQNINLVSRYIENHNKIYMREIDLVGSLGDPDEAGSEGLLNSSVFTSGAAAGAIGTLTAQQMYDEISDLITSQHSAVNNTPEYMANKVDMPVYVYNTLKSTILNSAGSEKTVLKALQTNFPDAEFRSNFRCNEAGGAGVSHTVAYSTNAEAMKLRIPVPLTIGEVIKVGSFDFHVDSKYRIAGMDVLESTAGYILTGL